ncbi:Crp/Fnr family transcriptional regulator [Ruegeria marina]|uniref:Cyclic nucleotide-binding domain-containing protein n=1 Tax=Ruegeria marina TaxID=639004 RepID=A0A1G6PJZ8_9RHOB|nr:cyclic nucleotide-binding domain-containing protein [Ruegeria marina]SDC79675.1 Cyclic nucleotide-binding domain-containing protein [Ruegeria marina]
MDLSFITDGWAGHLSYLLLVLSMLMRRMFWLRLFVIASALAGIAFDFFWLNNPVGVFWQALLVLVNLAELFILWRNDRRASFSSEEHRFREALLPGLSPGRTRRFLDMGRWETLAPGTVLTREGQPPDFLTYLDDGEVRIEAHGRMLRVVTGGHYIGEMSMMGDGRAVATATLQSRARVWRIERAKLRRLRDTAPATMAVLETGIARDMRAKLVFQNASNFADVSER